MTATITTTQLLEFIAKAQKISPDVKVGEGDNGYDIAIYADWDADDNFYTQSIFISHKGESSNFHEMSFEIDYLFRVEEERENKHKKRQELLSRLSDEEKELLGVS